MAEIPPSSCAGADAVRGLKTAVVVMGIMLVVGFVALIAAIAYRMSHPRVPSEPTTPSRPFSAPALDLPLGAHIEAMTVGADRLVLNLLLRDGGRQLLILDLSTGRL